MRNFTFRDEDLIIIRPSADQTGVEIVVQRRHMDGGCAGIVTRIDDERAVEMAERLLVCAREARHTGRMREIAGEVRRRRRS